MPFTGSHPAAILPLLRWGLVPSALVIGSMTPDTVYFVPVPISGEFTHSGVGVLSIDLLFGLLGFVAWHLLLAPAALALAGAGLQLRLPGGLPHPLRTHVGDRRAAGFVGLSLIAGSLTHVVWDDFTHEDRWGARHLGWLTSFHGGHPGYFWAQAASGIGGALMLAAWLALWWRRTPKTSWPLAVPVLPRSVAWTVVVLIAATSTLTGLAAALPWMLNGAGPDLHSAAYELAIWGGKAALAGTLLYALSWKAAFCALTWKARAETG